MIAEQEMMVGDNIHRLESHLQCQLTGRVRDLHLRVCDRGIILQGYSRTYYAKQLAQQFVMQASTVPILANEIEVS